MVPWEKRLSSKCGWAIREDTYEEATLYAPVTVEIELPPAWPQHQPSPQGLKQYNAPEWGYLNHSQKSTIRIMTHTHLLWDRLDQDYNNSTQYPTLNISGFAYPNIPSNPSNPSLSTAAPIDCPVITRSGASVTVSINSSPWKDMRSVRLTYIMRRSLTSKETRSVCDWLSGEGIRYWILNAQGIKQGIPRGLKSDGSSRF